MASVLIHIISLCVNKDMPKHNSETITVTAFPLDKEDKDIVGDYKLTNKLW